MQKYLLKDIPTLIAFIFPLTFTNVSTLLLLHLSYVVTGWRKGFRICSYAAYRCVAIVLVLLQVVKQHTTAVET